MGTQRAGIPPADTTPPGLTPDDIRDLLVTVGRARDRAAFIRLFHYFAPRLKFFLMRGNMTPEAAEELVQETMLSVWNRAATYDPARASASTWIFTIARNKKIDLLRKSNRIEIDLNDPAFVPDDDTPRPDSRLISAQRADAIARALKTLPPEQAALLQQSFFEDKPHTQIAEENALPLGTVKSRIRLALERMRTLLNGEAF